MSGPEIRGPVAGLDDHGDDGLYEAVTEINVLKAPSSERCQWDKGCSDRATHNVCQYNPYSLEDLVEGVDLLMCEPHARAMASRINEWEP
jgi:hypothetical protein